MSDIFQNKKYRLVIFAILLLVVFGQKFFTDKFLIKSDLTASSFVDCAQLGGVITESSPRQCNYNSQVFTEILKSESSSTTANQLNDKVTFDQIAPLDKPILKVDNNDVVNNNTEKKEKTQPRGTEFAPDPILVEPPVMPVDPPTPPYKTANGTLPATDGCVVGGCSGELCVDKEAAGFSTCLWREEYVCYKDSQARCERQSDGQCGWTPTKRLTQCLAGFKNNL